MMRQSKCAEEAPKYKSRKRKLVLKKGRKALSKRKLKAIPISHLFDYYESDLLIKSPELTKYWVQRYRLFSKFDEGIRLDHESWFSVTPESIASQTASKCVNFDLIIDGFCGAGGNLIQFAALDRQTHIIGIDIDPCKIELAKHNSKVYGISLDRVQFMNGDYFDVLKRLKADPSTFQNSNGCPKTVLIFLSPPWGGVDYCKKSKFDLKCDMPIDGFKIFKAALEISIHIVYYLPKLVEQDQLVTLLTSMSSDGSDSKGSFRYEQNLINGKVKSITAYFGDQFVF